MLRRLGLIAVCACFVTSVGCDGGARIGSPTGPTPPLAPTVTLEFGGRVVNADAGGPVGNVRVSPGVMSYEGPTDGWVRPNNSATSGEDGKFTLPLNLPSVWSFVRLQLTAPSGYDDTSQRYEGPGPFADPGGPTAVERPEIRMYPTLVIRPGESIDVRVERGIVACGWDGYSCRRVIVAASPGESVELEVVSHDSSKPMALGLQVQANPYYLEPDMSVRRLTVPSGFVPFVIAEYPAGTTATLTATRR